MKRHPRQALINALYDTFCGDYHPDRWEEKVAEFRARLIENEEAIERAEKLAQAEAHRE